MEVGFEEGRSGGTWTQHDQGANEAVTSVGQASMFIAE